MAPDSLAALAAQAADETQSLTLRRVALQRLLSRHPLASVATVQGVAWREFDGDDELVLSLAAALRSAARAEDARAAVAIARRLYGDLADAHPIIAEQLLRLVSLVDDGDEARRTLFELGRHLNVTIAVAGRDRYLESYGDFGLRASAEGGQALLDGLAIPELAQEMLRRARDLLEIVAPTSDEAATARAAMRRIVQHLKAEQKDPLQVLELVVPPAAPHDQWPAESLALPFIATHRAARDPEGTTFLIALLAHASAAVHRAALLALLELRPTPDIYWAIREHVLLSDLLAAAVDPSGPREALAYVLAHVPNDTNERLLVQFLGALERLGTVAEVPLVARLLDNGEKETIIAALHTLGAIGDAAVVPKIEAHAGGFFRGSDIKAAARAALAAIANRLARGAPRGSLSLAGDDGGLALSDGDEQ